eukprot:TRINITY_DN1213_c0_g5_i1.p1 TRINITY_DN1213_c0_g5~~TRINITY_DN1213_c0_g5_i1.p1  ORF type:complete len:515 (+),score=103.00 TRINITY_DN1213_c0_g5_i1:50-1594(+)
MDILGIRPELISGSLDVASIEDTKERRWSHRTAKTKIMCTLGPATRTKEKIIELLNEGMEIARFNLSHETHEFHSEVVVNLRQACKETGKNCALLLDTHGPEIRTGEMKEQFKNVILKQGQTFTFYVNFVLGDNEKCSIKNFFDLPKFVQKGDQIFVDYGKISFTIKSISKFMIVTEVDNEGSLGDNKIVTIVGKKANIEKPFLSYQDTVDIDFAVRMGFDVIAISYVSRAEDVEDIRSLPGVTESGIKLVSKIESQIALDNLEAIASVSDGIYVSRSDLAVEVPFYAMPHIQKRIATHCNKIGMPCILATQVLGSMAWNPRPTRAECTDITNAIFEGYDCIVLTDSTAGDASGNFGSYAVESVVRLNKQIKEAEKEIKYRLEYSKIRNFTVGSSDMSISESVASSAVKTAWDVEATLIIVLTTGLSEGYVAKYRPHTPILCVTDSSQTSRQVLIRRACISLLLESLEDREKASETAIAYAKKHRLIEPGELVVEIYGDPSNEVGVASVRVIKV